MNFHTSNLSENPDVSIFNGKMNINVNTGDQEAEDLEEERKQQEEVSEVMYLSINVNNVLVHNC